MTETTTAERKRYSIRKAIEKLKAEISIEDYLRSHGEEPRHNRARCIVHGSDNPQSFSIDPEKQLWHCFSCGQGGDLLDLCELAERHADTWTAVVSLSLQFGVELPWRPQRWHEWQGEKERRRKALLQVRTEHYQRHLFHLFRKDLAAIEDPEFRREEARRLWEAVGYVARRFAHDAA